MAKQNVHLFFGEDTYSSNQKLKYWYERFEQKYEGDTNIAVLEGKGLDAKNLESDIQSAPFLADKRLVIVYDFLGKGGKEEQKKVAEFLEEGVPDFCIVVFYESKLPDKRSALYKKLNKVGHIEEYKPLMGPELTRWISKKAEKIGLQLSFGLADYLGQVAGGDLWNLDNELNKLKLYSKTNPITREVIDELVHPNLTTNIFKFTDFIAQRNAKGSIGTLNVLLDSGEDLMKIIFMIVRHFRILIQVKDLMDRGNAKSDIISKVKEHPYTISTTMQQSPNFSAGALRSIYDSLLQIDIGIKTGKIRMLADDKKELMLALEKFVYRVCGN